MERIDRNRYVPGTMTSLEVTTPPENDLRGCPLDTLQMHFVNLYGRRNNIYFTSKYDRISFLAVATSDIHDAVRKEIDLVSMQPLLARTVSRIFCVAEGMNNLSLRYGMIEKYPATGCAYCGQVICICQERRDDVRYGAQNYEQKMWSLKDWQDHLQKTYGEKNNAESINYIIERLLPETTELMVEEQLIKRQNRSMDEIELGYVRELADCLAWTIAVANRLGINLEEAVIKKYGNGCRKCGESPCNCRLHDFSPVRARDIYNYAETN